jgi:hypothetical protein
MIRKLVVSLVFASLVFSQGCGNSFNLNRFVYSSSNEEAEFKALKERAQIAYDGGEFDKSANLAQQAYAIQPNDESVSVLLGFINLSRAGLDPVTIARRLIETGNGTDVAGCKSPQENASAGDVLLSLACILPLSDSDYAILGDSEQDRGIDVTGEFAQYPLIIPNQPGVVEDLDSVRHQINSLNNFNQAIKYVCPFVDDSSGDDGGIRFLEDSRHSCEQTKYNRESKSKAHLIWALAHLGEALAFANVIMYSQEEVVGLNEPEQEAETNLLKRIKLLNTVTFSNINEYMETLMSLKESADAIFALPAENGFADESMLQTTLINLKTTTAAFAAIAGLPTNMTAPVIKILDKVEATAEIIKSAESGEISDIEAKTKALQGQLNKKAAAQLESSINKFTQKQGGIGSFSEAQKTNICNSYQSFVSGLDPSEVQAPLLCE